MDLKGNLTGHIVQELVFVTEQMAGSNDSHIRVHFLDTLFSLGLGPQKFGLGIMRRVQVREMYKSRDTSIGSNLGNSLCASGMHIIVVKIPVYILSERARKMTSKALTWSHNRDRRDCIRCQSVSGIPQFAVHCECPIPMKTYYCNRQ